MKLTAELSLYPVQDDYIAIIQAFIDALRTQADLQVVGKFIPWELELAP